VEPLTSQMADYLGVTSGLMVKQVAYKSEAATAGLKAFDVILKVGSEPVTNLAGWDRALRSNQGKPVLVTILRDRKQQTLTLQVDSKHKQGELQYEEIFLAGEGPIVAELFPELSPELSPELDAELDAGIGPELDQQLGWDSKAAAEALRDQAKALQDQVRGMHLELSPQQADELRKQAEKLRDSLKVEDFKFKDFKIDQKQLDELKQQMEDWRKDFKPEDFKPEDFKPEDFKPEDF